MKVLPIGPYLTVERDMTKVHKQGAIWIPDSEVHDHYVGTVIEVGEGYVSPSGVKIPLEVSVGDRISYRAEHGTSIVRSDGTETRILKESEVLCILT